VMLLDDQGHVDVVTSYITAVHGRRPRKDARLRAVIALPEPFRQVARNSFRQPRGRNRDPTQRTPAQQAHVEWEERVSPPM
jgi:hypothetical protein